MAEDSRKMRLVGSFDEYGYRPGLAGSLAQGLFRAAQPTRYPRSVGERLIGGVFDGLATHRNMRIQDDLAIAEREKREIEMEELRRTANINRQLEDLRMNYMSGDYLGRPMSTSDFIRQGAMLRGDPKTLLDLATLEKTTFDLDSSTVNKLLDIGATFEDINNYRRTGTATPALQEAMAQERRETRETKDLEQEKNLEDIFYNQIDKYTAAEKKFAEDQLNLIETQNRKEQMISDLNQFTQEGGEFRNLIEKAAGVDYRTKIAQITNPQIKATLEAVISDIESRIAFQNLINLKKKGGTLGALSEGEFKALAKDLGSLSTEMDVGTLLSQLSKIQRRVTSMYDAGLKVTREDIRSSAKTARLFGKRANENLEKRGYEPYDLSRFVVPPLKGEKRNDNNNLNVATGDEEGGLEKPR